MKLESQRQEFSDRHAAGRALARLLGKFAGHENVVVLALPRGGVPVGYEVAKALGAPLDVLVVRKLGVPYHRELAMGAIASGGALYLNADVIRAAAVSERQIEMIHAEERAELLRRERVYRGDRPAPDVRGCTVILVDDGLATGSSMHAAVSALRGLDPAAIVVAVPVAPIGAADSFAGTVDEFISVMTPEDFHGVGQFYRHFGDTSDAEVRELLSLPRQGQA